MISLKCLSSGSSLALLLSREPGHSSLLVSGHDLPVIVCELAAFDIWHRDHTTALVLAVPNGAGNLQHSQHSSIPVQGEKMPSLLCAQTSCSSPLPFSCLAQNQTHFPSKFKPCLSSLYPILHVSHSFTQTNGMGKEEMKSGEFKAVFSLSTLNQVLLSLASQGSKSYATTPGGRGPNLQACVRTVSSTLCFNRRPEQQQAAPPVLCHAGQLAPHIGSAAST